MTSASTFSGKVFGKATSTFLNVSSYSVIVMKCESFGATLRSKPSKSSSVKARVISRARSGRNVEEDHRVAVAHALVVAGKRLDELIATLVLLVVGLNALNGIGIGLRSAG